jgi:hypothetical protein
MRWQKCIQLAWFIAMAALIAKVAWKETPAGVVANMVFYSCAGAWLILKIVAMVISGRDSKNTKASPADLPPVT